MKLVSVIRTSAYFVLYLLSKLSSKRYAVVLVYHSIESNGSYFSVTPVEFDRQIEYLMKNFSIISLEEISEFVTGKRELPRKSVAITFDDGYYDNYENMYPYAKKYGLPFAIFVATGYVGKEMLLGNVPLRMLGWNELSEMSRSGVTIGAHTLSHVDLRHVDTSDATNQIVRSKTEIEEATGKPVCFFAYPFGEHSGTLGTLLKSAGFTAGFKTGDGLILHGDNPFLLSRVSVDSSVSFSIFRAKLTVATIWYREIERVVAAIVHRFPFLSGIANIYNKKQLELRRGTGN